MTSKWKAFWRSIGSLLNLSAHDPDLHSRVDEILNTSDYDALMKDKEALASDWKVLAKDWERVTGEVSPIDDNSESGIKL